MIAALLSALLVLAGIDGSPWERMNVEGLERAVRVQTAVQVTPSPIDVYQPPELEGPCAEWAPLALEVGWPREQWPTISRVMWCESKCQPTAYNRSGASGLMQVMPMHWHGRDPFDPRTNLEMALEVHERQGWRAWSCY